MECKPCKFKCALEKDLHRHNNTDKHRSIIEIYEDFKKKLEEAIQREQTLKQEIVKANLETEKANLGKQREMEQAEEKLKDCRLKALNKNNEMELINLQMFKHLRDHDIDLTTGDCHSKLSAIETSFISSKSTCESGFHDNLKNILLESIGTNSINNCHLCLEFKQYSDKVLNKSDLIENEFVNNLNESNNNTSVKKPKKTKNSKTHKPIDINLKIEKQNKQKRCKTIKATNANNESHAKPDENYGNINEKGNIVNKDDHLSEILKYLINLGNFDVDKGHIIIRGKPKIGKTIFANDILKKLEELIDEGYIPKYNHIKLDAVEIKSKEFIYDELFNLLFLNY
jgi:hypothetical protein